jgi:ATP-binding cassette subfamily F protein 3
MEALSTKTLELTPGTNSAPAKERLFYGNYSYYLDRVSSEQQGSPAAPSTTQERPQFKTDANEKRILDKQRQAETRRLERQEAKILKALEELEKTKAALETELALPDVYSNGQKARDVKIKIDECTAAIEVKTKEWETIVGDL